MPYLDDFNKYRKLFVGGLSYLTTNESLKKYFEQWGRITDVIIVRDRQFQRSRGFGFITYSQPYMVDQAMVNRPHKLDGRSVETKRFIPRNNIGSQGSAIIAVNKVFVYGIKECSKKLLFRYFGKFGKILDIAIVINKHSGQRKGYGFIEYEDKKSVDEILLTRIHIVSGVTLYLRKAIYRTIGIDKVRHSEQSNVNVQDGQDINGRQDIQDIQGCHESQGYKGSGSHNWGSDSHNEYYNSFNFSGGVGYGNYETGVGYSEIYLHEDGYNGSIDGYNLNSGGAYQDIHCNSVPQYWTFNNYPVLNHSLNGWEYLHETSKNWSPNQCFVYGSPLVPISSSAISTPSVIPEADTVGVYS